MHMSPEAITDPSAMDGRADLYAVGAAGYCLLTGRHVFAAANAVEMCSKHLTEEPVPPSQRIDVAIATDLERAILWCLAKRRENRPASAAALRAAFLACTDAAAFDEAAARTWWAGWRTRRPSLTPASPHAPTMAIQWEGREALRR